MAKPKKKPAPRKPPQALSAPRGRRQSAGRPDEMGEGGRRGLRRSLLCQRRVDLGRPAAGQAREARGQRGPRPAAARLRRPALGLGLLDRLRAQGDAHARRARGEHGARGAGGSLCRPRAGRAAGHQLARPRSRRQAPAAFGQGAAGARGRGRGCRALGEGRHQLRGRRGELEPLDHDAGHQQRLQRRQPAWRLLAVLRGAGRRRHRHGARLRMVERASISTT